jgi:hypothetical protein
MPTTRSQAARGKLADVKKQGLEAAKLKVETGRDDPRF